MALMPKKDTVCKVCSTQQGDATCMTIVTVSL